ncbi:hypothetical protein Ocin01_16188, partial [Orchesella cincta]
MDFAIITMASFFPNVFVSVNSYKLETFLFYLSTIILKPQELQGGDDDCIVQH